MLAVLACPCLSAINHDEYARAHYGGAHQNDRRAAKKVGHIQVALKGERKWDGAKLTHSPGNSVL